MTYIYGQDGTETVSVATQTAVAVNREWKSYRHEYPAASIRLQFDAAKSGGDWIVVEIYVNGANVYTSANLTTFTAIDQTIPLETDDILTIEYSRSGAAVGLFKNWIRSFVSWT